MYNHLVEYVKSPWSWIWNVFFSPQNIIWIVYAYETTDNVKKSLSVIQTWRTYWDSHARQVRVNNKSNTCYIHTYMYIYIHITNIYTSMKSNSKYTRPSERISRFIFLTSTFKRDALRNRIRRFRFGKRGPLTCTVIYRDH